MKFFVHAQAANVAMSRDDVSLLTATQRQLSDLPQIESVMSFAGERAFALVVNVDTAAELDHLVFGLAGERLMGFDVHVIAEQRSQASVRSSAGGRRPLATRRSGRFSSLLPPRYGWLVLLRRGTPGPSFGPGVRASTPGGPRKFCAARSGGGREMRCRAPQGTSR